MRDRYTSTTGSAECATCVEGNYMNEQQKCKLCANVVKGSTKDFPGVKCGLGTTLKGLQMLNGFYRFSDSSTEAYPCAFPRFVPIALRLPTSAAARPRTARPLPPAAKTLTQHTHHHTIQELQRWQWLR